MFAMMKFFETENRTSEADTDVVWLRPRGDSYVRVDGRDYHIRRWNLEGFSAAPFDGALVRGQKATVTVMIRDIADPQGALQMECEITVTAVDGNRLDARWHRLPRYKKDRIADYYQRKSG